MKISDAIWSQIYTKLQRNVRWSQSLKEEDIEMENRIMESKQLCVLDNHYNVHECLPNFTQPNLVACVSTTQWLNPFQERFHYAIPSIVPTLSQLDNVTIKMTIVA